MLKFGKTGTVTMNQRIRVRMENANPRRDSMTRLIKVRYLVRRNSNLGMPQGDLQINDISDLSVTLNSCVFLQIIVNCNKIKKTEVTLPIKLCTPLGFVSGWACDEEIRMSETTDHSYTVKELVGMLLDLVWYVPVETGFCTAQARQDLTDWSWEGGVYLTIGGSL